MTGYRLGIVVSAFVAVAVSAQSKPNFSGDWVLDGSPSQMVVTNGRSLPMGTPYSTAFTLTQDANKVTIVNNKGATVLSVALDGTPTHDVKDDGFDYATTASLSADKLVITIQTHLFQPTRTFSFDEKGNLILEMLAPGDARAKFVYRKKA